MPLQSRRPLWQTYLLFLGPMLLSNVLQSLSGTLNNIFIGQFLGLKALAAVSGFFPLLYFFITLSIGLGAGSSILIGRAWGARDHDRVRAVAGTALCLSAVLGLTVAACGLLWTRELLVWLGTPPDILPDAVRHGQIMFLAVPPLFLFMLVTAMMRGTGDTVTPLLALMVSTLGGLTLTPAFIHGWLGLPALGITSAAWATLVSMTVANLWLFWYLRRKRHVLAPDALLWRHLTLRRALLKPVAQLGLPTGLFMVTSSLSDLALLSVVNGYGSHATAAWGAVSQVMNYVQFPAVSIAIAASVLGAQAIGAGQAHRLQAIVRTGLGLNLALTGGLALVCFGFAREIVGLFITDKAVVDTATRVLHTTLVSSVLFGMASVLSAVMRASGTILVPTLISLSCLILLLAPLGRFFGRHFGLEAVWAAYPSTFLCALVLQAIFYRAVWRRRNSAEGQR